MENQQPVNSQCGELERLAAAAAAMDYTETIPQSQNQKSAAHALSHSDSQSVHDHSPVAHVSRSIPVPSVPQIISYVEPYNIQKGHQIIQFPSYETQAYVQGQSQAMQTLSGSRVVMLNDDSGHNSPDIQFSRPVTHLAVTAIHQQNNQLNNESCVQPIFACGQAVHCSTSTNNSEGNNASSDLFNTEPTQMKLPLKKEETATVIKSHRKRNERKVEPVKGYEEEEEEISEERGRVKVTFECNQCRIELDSEEAHKEHCAQKHMPKRCGLPLELKIEIIERINSGERNAHIAQEYGVNASTVKSIMKKADCYLACWKKGLFNPHSKRLKGAKREDIENALYSWYKQALEHDTPVSGPILCAKATDFAKKLGHSDFKPTHGWLDRFKKRKRITFGRGASKKKREDKKPECLTSLFPQMLVDYESTNIFAVELLGLFFTALPSACNTLKGNKCAGGVKAKDRVTIVMCTNMTGTEKFPLLVSGCCKKGFVMKNAKILPVHYIVDQYSWLTNEIISSWLLDMDSWFTQQGRKVVLLAPPSPIYTNPPKLRAIKFVVMPQGYPSPLRQIAVPYFKKIYRKKILEQFMAFASRVVPVKCCKLLKLKLPFFNALQILAATWQALPDNVVASSFQRSGLTKYGVWGMVVPADSPEFSGIQELLRNTGHILEGAADKTFDEFVHFDDSIQVCNMLGDDDILAKVKGSPDDDEECSDEDEQNKENEWKSDLIPSVTDVENALGVIRKYIQYQEGAQEMFRVIEHLENLIYKNIPERSTNQFMQ